MLFESLFYIEAKARRASKNGKNKIFSLLDPSEQSRWNFPLVEQIINNMNMVERKSEGHLC